MTFGTAEETNSMNESVALKVSHGDEIRRVAHNNETTFDGLCTLVANLFGLDSSSLIVKYQDNDGDKITMSSDGELKDAIQSAKEQKVLRLFVDVKVPLQAPEKQEEKVALPLGFGRRGLCGPRAFGPHYGPHFHHHGPHPRGDHGPHPPHHGPHHGSHPPHHGPHHGVHSGPRHLIDGPRHPPHHGPHPGAHPPHHGSHSHHHGSHPPHHVSRGPRSHHHGPHPHGPHGGHHGRPEFVGRHFPFVPLSPAEPVPVPTPTPAPEQSEGPKCGRDARKLYKERKCAAKHQIKLMKANAKTPEDMQAVLMFKMQMRAECKRVKMHAHRLHHGEKECKRGMKGDRLVARHVADVTIPDHSELPADTPVTKTWRLKNVGTTAWPEDSQLIFISRLGDNLNGPERVQVGTVAPDHEVDVSVSFITPSEPGKYTGYYRMASSGEGKFGQRVWVSFFIPAEKNTMNGAGNMC